LLNPFLDSNFLRDVVKNIEKNDIVEVTFKYDDELKDEMRGKLKIGRFEKLDLESAVASALEQIETRKYDSELKTRGVDRILHIGMAFQGKDVLIRAKTV